MSGREFTRPSHSQFSDQLDEYFETRRRSKSATEQESGLRSQNSVSSIIEDVLSGDSEEFVINFVQVEGQ